ncbi:MAG: transcriptional regulator [bacterium]|nr:transcriptional regulator [bacterium]
MRRDPPYPPPGGDGQPTVPPTPLAPLIHGRARLLVMSHLMRSGATAFTELRALLGLTDGTLSVHLATLEQGGAVEIVKEFVGKKPRTVVRPTPAGREMFARYVAELKQIVPGLSPGDA